MFYRNLAAEAQAAYDSAMEIAESALEAAFDDDALGSLSFLSREVGGAREIVKNAPYSAEAVTDRTQVLMDGNRIVRKSVTLLARDSAGRTRQRGLAAPPHVAKAATSHRFHP